jgi:NADH:ubiquinone oxidoreductase subunit H
MMLFLPVLLPLILTIFVVLRFFFIVRLLLRVLAERKPVAKTRNTVTPKEDSLVTNISLRANRINFLLNETNNIHFR